jgi:hypothetical protein
MGCKEKTSRIKNVLIGSSGGKKVVLGLRKTVYSQNSFFNNNNNNKF